MEPQISDEEILRLAGIGVSVADIATRAGVSVGTIRRRFMHLIKRGRADYHIGLLERQWALCQDTSAKGNATMLIWKGKVDLQQQEVQKIDHSVSGTCKIGKLVVRDTSGRVLVFASDTSDVEEYTVSDSTSSTADEPKVS